ncbi:MAG: SET domain-containing protein [Phycisphaerales bacterium]|nr:SET domain-containing protein [Phycisphaerales bacterium]
MLIVCARAGISANRGIGLIAVGPIDKGTKVWEFVPGFDRVLTEDDVLALSDAARDQVRWYAYHYDGEDGRRVWVLSGDDDRFTNHSNDPNTMTMHDPASGPLHLAPSFATRNIQPGEEITWNDAEFHGLNSDLRAMLAASST